MNREVISGLEERNPDVLLVSQGVDGVQPRGFVGSAFNSEERFVWCVRGGMNADTY